MSTYSIYKITSPSGKVYIGQSKHVQKRLKDYQCSNTVKHQTVIYNSLVKYGYEKHIVEILYQNLTSSEANSLEIMEISKFKILGISMNITEGGQRLAYTRNKPIIKCDLSGSFLKRYDNIVEAAKEINGLSTAISAVIRKNTFYYKGFLYISEEDWDNGKRPIWKAKLNNKSTLSKKLYQFDLDGNLVAEYNSAEEAGRVLNIKATSISAVLRNKVFRCKNWLFSYSNTISKYKDPRAKSILQLDEQGVIIKEFSSLSQVKKELSLGNDTITKMLKNNYIYKKIILKYKNNGNKREKKPS